MNEVTMANIIKNLSDELYATAVKLRETEYTLKRTQDDASDWFMKWQEAKKEIDLLKAAEKLNTDLPNMGE
jgi:hypothetical protein